MNPRSPYPESDLARIRGQWHAKRAMEIAAAGGHNLLLHGARGVGKTRLALAFASLLPPLTPNEQIEVSYRYSLQGLLSPQAPLVTERPFRLLTPDASLSQVMGGGGKAGYGEVTLAHRGVLLLDDLAAFQPEVLQAVSTVLDQRSLPFWDTSRQRPRTIPAHVQLVASTLPCPCGLFSAPGNHCTCSAEQRLQYRSRGIGAALASC